jgi:HAD superfamily hydrolase (TIGR01457 family)
MSLADLYDCFLLDLDGVLYRGDQAVAGAPESISRLRRNGRHVVFMTNNSSRTPEQVARTLLDLGFHAEPQEVVTSAVATADLLAGRGGGTAFVIGEEGITTALRRAGLQVLDDAPDRSDHVVVGWDRSVDYAKLRTAAVLVERGAHLIATNPDASYPAPDGTLWPGAGALLAVITTTTGRDAEVVGKPNAPMFEAALRRAGGGRALVVGDRLDTDIAGANALELDSLLVLTGVVGPEDLGASPVGPTYVGHDLSALFADPAPDATPRPSPGKGHRPRGYPGG